MASEAARAIVAQLQAGGLSLASIGRALDRDSSMLSQVARGARGAGYGSNLVPALDALRSRISTGDGGTLSPEMARGAARIVAESRSIDVPRRRTNAGRVAPVRAGIKPAGPKDAALPGAYTRGSVAGKSETLRKVLRSADQTGQLVYINVTTSTGERVGLGAKTADEWRALGLDPDNPDGFDWDDVITELGDAGELGSDVSDVAGWSASLIAA